MNTGIRAGLHGTEIPTELSSAIDAAISLLVESQERERDRKVAMGKPDHTKLVEELAADRERFMHTPESRQKLVELRPARPSRDVGVRRRRSRQRHRMDSARRPRHGENIVLKIRFLERRPTS